MPKNDNRTVWSSEQGDLRKKEQNSAGTKSLPPQQQTVYLHRDSGGRVAEEVRVGSRPGHHPRVGRGDALHALR